MKILIICSKVFYKDIEPIKEKLESMGHVVELPNSYYDGNLWTRDFDRPRKKYGYWISGSSML